ncbi:MAG: O-antigen ligase family protein [Gammaproteobacteria bacterium]|nr:O-antigen ligase family protein [Gammaproteobacteria bacterium]
MIKFLLPNNNEKLWTKTIELFNGLIWMFYLCLVIGASFVHGNYMSSQWLFFSGVFYLWFGFALLVQLFQPKISVRGLKSAYLVSVLLCLSIFWLILQISLTHQSVLHDMLVNSIGKQENYRPDWFEPSYLWSVEPEKTRWLALSELLMLCIFFSTIYLVNSRTRLQQLLITLLVVGLFHSLMGIYGKFFSVIFVDMQQLDGHWSAARSYFVNRNHYGALIVLSSLSLLSYIFAKLIKEIPGRRRIYHDSSSNLKVIALAILTIIFIFALAASESRGASLSIVAGMILCFLVSSTSFTIKRRNMLIFILLISILVLIVLADGLLQRLIDSSLSIGEREQQWRITIEAILANPLLGYGGGSYSTVFQIFREEAPLRNVMYAQAHNHYLHLWLERGFIGLCMWLLIFFFVLRQCLVMLAKVQSRLVIGVLNACLVIISAALIQSLVDYNLQNLTLRVYFFVTIALVYAAPYVRLK